MLYGSAFWKEILNFDALVRHGMISAEDLQLFQVADDPDSAMSILKEGLNKYYLQPEKGMADAEMETPAIAKSRV